MKTEKQHSGWSLWNWHDRADSSRWNCGSGIWFYSLMWECGQNQAPAEFLNDRGIIKNNVGAV